MRLVAKFIHALFYKWLSVKSIYYKELFLSCGKGLRLYGLPSIKNPGNIILGHNVSINDGAYLNGLGGIKVGSNVSISALSIIVSTGLASDSFLTDIKHINMPIIIGDNVQIGAGAIILPGIQIGNNVIVGAGAVVTKNIESYCVVVGNPAKVLKKQPQAQHSLKN